ncbi:unnamed protein product [marine sediment metagenome]|uniref:DUF4345 domain-containing protein n=1 Tax=marine sediment metagenome TaxID=412755 RepID=X0U986_9ZZZZ
MKGMKIILWIAAICCLSGFAAAALPWPTITALFHWFGIQPPAAEPVTAFGFRLASAMFGMIGIFFLILARNPLKYGAMLLLAAYGLVAYGVFCLLGGIRYALPVYTYAGDLIFGVVAGVLLLVFRKRAMQTNSA